MIAHGPRLLFANEALLGLAIAVERLGHGPQVGVLARRGQEARLVLDHLGGAQHRAELLVALGDVLQLVVELLVHDRGGRGGRARGVGEVGAGRFVGRASLQRAIAPGTCRLVTPSRGLTHGPAGLSSRPVRAVDACSGGLGRRAGLPGRGPPAGDP